MSVLHALQSAQFVTDTGGHRNAVLVDYEAWQRLIKWLETLSDQRAAREALEPHLKQLDNSEFIDWNDAKSEWLEGS